MPAQPKELTPSQEDARAFLAERIRELASDTSLRQVAEQADISRGYLDKLVAGSSSPTVDKLVVLAEALGCTPAELLPGRRARSRRRR